MRGSKSLALTHDHRTILNWGMEKGCTRHFFIPVSSETFMYVLKNLLTFSQAVIDFHGKEKNLLVL